MISTAITILSMILAIIAWLAKIKWSNEYRMVVERELKEFEGRLKSKDEEITRMEKIYNTGNEQAKERGDFYKEQLELMTQHHPNQVVLNMRERIVDLENENQKIGIENSELKLELESLKGEDTDVTWAKIFADIKSIQEDKNQIRFRVAIDLGAIFLKMGANHQYRTSKEDQD